jgi:hypothetical protein
MTTAEITQKYSARQGLSLREFAAALSATGERITHQSVKNWQDDIHNPNRGFLMRTIANFPSGDWRHDWASEVLQAIQ